MKKRILLLLMVVGIGIQPFAQPRPTPQQRAWHDMEFYLFMHFGPNTFTNLEWGKGTEQPELFDPVNLDCNQWCRIAKASGATGIIITAKHHDGFCLWPSKYSTHTVRESKWKNGKGDVLKELSQACKRYGLKFGVYLSPWDRNHPKYGTDEYNDVFVNMLKEIFANYGPIWELWWDGANGEGPNGKKQVYDFRRYENLIRKLSPRTIIFSDIGPDIRWCGNESGIAGETNWNRLDTAGFKRGAGGPPQNTLNTGNVRGKLWIPAECDVSIRPGWFYHQEEDKEVKTPELLFDLYLKSVGRGANLLLNVPPDRRGLITKYDSAALVEFKKLKDKSFAVNKALHATFMCCCIEPCTSSINAVDGNPVSSIVLGDLPCKNILRFKQAQWINTIVIKEDMLFGQSFGDLKLILTDINDKTKEIQLTTVGHKRIITFPAIQVKSVTLLVNSSHYFSAITEIEAYLIEERLVGEVGLTPTPLRTERELEGWNSINEDLFDRWQSVLRHIVTKDR